MNQKSGKFTFDKKRLYFLIVFTLLGLAALQVPVTQLVGSKVKFTLFDFFGPIAPAFIGTPGIVAVFLMQFANFLLHGAQVVDAGTIIRFFPMLFGAWYFGRKSKYTLLVPVLAILAFNLHPIGQSVWYYSLYWLIPIACYFVYEKTLIARALGATFTAHAVGGALWIYAFNLPKAVWVSLIPVVAIERLLFAGGIVVTYLVFNSLLNVLAEKRYPSLKPLVNQNYAIKLSR
jgi:hypothetical protein